MSILIYIYMPEDNSEDGVLTEARLTEILANPTLGLALRCFQGPRSVAEESESLLRHPGNRRAAGRNESASHVHRIDKL